MTLKAGYCDKCGAIACVTAVIIPGSSLSFCGHHAAEYDDALREAGAVIHDDRLTATTPRP